MPLGDTREKVHFRVLMLCWWYVHVHIWIVWFDGWNRLLFHICVSCLYWRDGWGNITSSWDPLKFGWGHSADYCGALHHHNRVDMQLFSMQWCSDLALHSIASWQVVWHLSSDAWGCSWVDHSKLPLAYVFFRCTQYGGEKLCADVILKKISNPSKNAPCNRQYNKVRVLIIEPSLQSLYFLTTLCSILCHGMVLVDCCIKNVFTTN